jgi:hypothetical protein
MRRAGDGAPLDGLPRGALPGEGVDDLRIDEGARSFFATIRSSYRDSPYKRERGGIMTEDPRLSRPCRT